eukprot:scaffold51372_cov58-Phaeocystis_antarctica.AAC.3
MEGAAARRGARARTASARADAGLDHCVAQDTPPATAAAATAAAAANAPATAASVDGGGGGGGG